MYSYYTHEYCNLLLRQFQELVSPWSKYHSLLDSGGFIANATKMVKYIGMMRDKIVQAISEYDYIFVQILAIITYLRYFFQWKGRNARSGHSERVALPVLSQGHGGLDELDIRQQ